VTVDAPAAFVFTPASLPLFGAGLSRYHPIDRRDLSVPCFLYSTDSPPSPVARREDATVRAVAPDFLDGLQDVVTVLRASRAFAERLGMYRRPSFRLGFDAGSDVAQVRARFEAHAPVLDADELLRERHAEREARDGEAYRRVLRMRHGAPRLEHWDRARDYLLGGGDRPSLDPGDHRTFQALPALLQDVSPRDWDEVQRRALDLVVQFPTLLTRVERNLMVDDPAGDAFLAWHELLAERGVGDDAVESLAIASWTHVSWTQPGAARSPRAWWILARARADLDGFLRRNEAVERSRLLAGLFHAATAVWQSPPFRAVAETVLTRCGDELPTHAVEYGLRWYGDVVAPLVRRHADAVFNGRSEAQRQSLRALLER
jgi:hypothetical protein